MHLPLKLTVFEGPMELLMHLIDKNKINIYDIPIVTITEQYLSYIREMESLDLELMSDFLVMAATLIHIKSKMLLPPPAVEEQGGDPRQELVERLLEYKKFKLISRALYDRQQDASRMLFKKQSIPEGLDVYEEIVDVEALLKDVKLSRLYQIFNSMVKRKNDRIDPVRSKFGSIQREEISIEARIEAIRDVGKQRGQLSFIALLEEQHSKQEVIVTFLAVLELIKMGIIHIIQDKLFDDIEIHFKT